MKILGVDPGLGRTGWAIIEENSGKLKAVDYNCIETSKKSSEAERIKHLYSEITNVIEKQNPEVLSIERLFFNKNVTTALAVGQARGVVILAAATKGLTISEYTPLQVKMAVAGYGRAEKSQIGKMVKAILALKEIPKPDDTADALAVALTHAFSSKLDKFIL